MEITRLRYPEKKLITHKNSTKNTRRFIWVIAVVFFVSVSGYTILALNKPLPTIYATQYLLKKTDSEKDIALAWPTTGQAAIGSQEQGVLASTENQSSVPIASTAKVITALAVLNKKPILTGSQGETIILGERDVDLYNYYLSSNGSSVAVSEGEHISEYQALEAMLLPSANNIADSLAIWAFGSVDAYTIYTNDMLRHMNASHTVVADASGFSNLTVSTAHDLVLIGQKALGNQVLKQIVSEKQAEIPVAGIVYNVNRLLGQQNIIGIKTGNTEEAGSCLLFAATHAIDSKHSVTIIGAITGAVDLRTVFDSSLALLQSAGPHFKAITVLPTKSKVGSYKTTWGDRSDIYSTTPINVYGWTGKSYGISLKLKNIHAPLEKGTLAGTVAVDSIGQSDSTTVITETTLKSPSVSWRLRHYF